MIINVHYYYYYSPCFPTIIIIIINAVCYRREKGAWDKAGQSLEEGHELLCKKRDDLRKSRGLHSVNACGCSAE